VPASRPYWNGYLKLSFVSCPVALYPAASAAERVSLRQVNRRTGHRLRHRLVDSITGEDVPATDKARGYEVSENELLFVEDRDLAQARSERPPPGALPVDEPPLQRPSPPTVPTARGARMSPKMTKSSAKRTNRKHRRRKLRRSRARRTPAQSRSSDLFRRDRSTRAILRNPTTLSRVGRSARNRSR
jgi:hypothetical protein